MTKSKAVEEKKNNTEVSTMVLGSRADAGKGLENADSESFQIPRLKILQALSPEVAEKKVKGAESGMFINTLTNELLEEVFFVPCSFKRQYLQWETRDNGGGFKGFHSTIDVDTKKIETSRDPKTGRLMFGDDLLNDTREHFIMMKTASGSWQPASMSLAVTQINSSKNLMALIISQEKEDEEGSYTPSSFSNIYKATTTLTKNDKGSWYIVCFEHVEEIEDPILYAKCEVFHDQVSDGLVETAVPEADGKDKF